MDTDASPASSTVLRLRVEVQSLLVDGRPLTDIADTLSIRGVWRGGVRLATS